MAQICHEKSSVNAYFYDFDNLDIETNMIASSSGVTCNAFWRIYTVVDPLIISQLSPSLSSSYVRAPPPHLMASVAPFT